MRLLNFLHEIIFSGGIKKGGSWGGPACSATLSSQLNLFESALWIIPTVIIYFVIDVPGLLADLSLKARQKPVSKRSGWQNLDLVFGGIHSLMWLQVLYYKINLRSLVNLLQPCHLALLLQGVAAFQKDEYFITLATLPWLTGAASALLNPATDGLDQPFEEISFFIQHYLLLITPMYLLCRNNFFAAELLNTRFWILANLYQMFFHWGFLAVSFHNVISGLFI